MSLGTLFDISLINTITSFSFAHFSIYCPLNELEPRALRAQKGEEEDATT
jgi:hypothetical protein